MSRRNVFGLMVIFLIWSCSRFKGIVGVGSLYYGEALTKSLLYYEAQRSGKLPHNQRVLWRGDSALNDGSTSQVNLVGGYYDAGDNLKLGFPMAFTITMLSWSTIEFRNHLKAKNELIHALQAIKWGTDYLIKAHPQADVLYGEIGDCDSDHSCWQRPEDMTTPRTVFRIDDQHPGSDLAAETTAALAAASISFRWARPRYSSLLLSNAEQLFKFASSHPGIYQNSIPEAGKVYPSSGSRFDFDRYGLVPRSSPRQADLILTALPALKPMRPPLPKPKSPNPSHPYPPDADDPPHPPPTRPSPSPPCLPPGDTTPPPPRMPTSPPHSPALKPRRR
ncbi:hypothetical protein TIFTF001_047701 [Ficus carica]|uniref:cellulase n=1 Tax=Ficus carica TaxID=3494 RepID=A0AA88CKQ6_FICCA|nr:hypothetical protein TIFTF001_047701 [Ficus carica]